ALQAAQIASKSKTMFLSNMSHDIRTPMKAVLGFTTLLAKDAENPDKVREYTKKIMASGQHLLSLINDILDVSKIESGKVVLTVEEFTLNDLVSSVDAIIRPMAKARDQKFHVEVTGIKHEYLMGDETRINQILINLLSNSVKYTPEGGNIWFRIIGLKQRSSQFEHIRIEVEDDGYGMTPEYLKTIFDAFTRAENSTTNKVQGTGLGMAITKNIVELMGGTIDVSSEVDKGSLFRVELEFRIPEGQADKQFWEKSGISRILSVESDVQNGENMQALMQDTGVCVDTALNPEEAIKMARESGEEGYQMVLLDWDNPDIDGLYTAEKIREVLPQTIPFLFLTDYGTDGMEEALRAEKTGILAKPFFVSALKEKVMEMQAGDSEQNNESETVQNDSIE
ncbi:MAG: response regulator, partial [Lachnospiraceae bacterium]|nr:response regulator [Lachnospiraceae bacterium]